MSYTPVRHEFRTCSNWGWNLGEYDADWPKEKCSIKVFNFQKCGYEKTYDDAEREKND